MRHLLFIIILCISSQAYGYDRTLWLNYPSMNYVTGLAEGTESIYVATTGGIRRWDRFAQRWQAPLTQLDGLPDNRVQRIVFDPNSRELWFDTPAGTGRWLEGLQVILLGGVVPPDNSRQFFQMPPVVPPFGYYVESNHIIGPRQNYAITHTLIDGWKNLWIGTWGLGVGMANLNDYLLRFDKYGPIEENVTALALDHNNIWIGGENTPQAPARGISRYNRNTQNWDYFQADQIIGLENSQVLTILPDTNTVWFGTYAGLTRYNKRANRWLTYRETEYWGRINALAKDHHMLWIGSERGLGLLNTKNDSLDRVSGSERATIIAMATGPSHIWAGTETGLYYCTRGTRTWRAAKDKQNFTHRSIRALTIQDSILWVATEHPSTLLRYHTGDQTWQEYPLAEIGGSPHVTITANNKHVWVSTNQGAFLLDISSRLWTRYGTIDGLIHDQTQAVLLDSDYVWFGTARGVSRFHWARSLLE